MELGQYDIKFLPRATIKAQALADFVVEFVPGTHPLYPIDLASADLAQPTARIAEISGGQEVAERQEKTEQEMDKPINLPKYKLDGDIEKDQNEPTSTLELRNSQNPFDYWKLFIGEMWKLVVDGVSY